ncbi:Alpha-tocopherol transfer protein-like [Habropoda laboriosa]|uniref:Alpha-tocopherol transfer protein-like n=2 Tax=Habropoda laboriosa TaxID=597456 RepID=A0A0L7QYN3_9HYME|nr:Alpha-tocopherol transfer protein-like [Habropoda laboriosa]
MATLNEYICQLSEEEKAYVRDNLNECDETRPIKIAEIKQWITENEELHVPTDDFVILRFLRACKFNTEKAKCKLRNYYKQRACVPEWYSNRDPFLPELQELFDLGVLLPLRKLDNEGRMIVIVRTAVHTPSRHKMSDMLKVALMTLDLALRDHESVTIYGITAILDIGGMTYEHVLQLPPNVIKNLVHAWQGCYPVRIHSLNFINAHKFVNAILNIFRSFMITKLKQRVHVHARGKLKLYETLPISILPVEYGGTDGTVKELSEYWKRTVKENSKWFAEEENYKLMLIK